MHDGLLRLCARNQRDPHDGHLVAFVGRRGDRVKSTYDLGRVGASSFPASAIVDQWGRAHGVAARV